MIIKFLKNFAFTFTTLSLLDICFYNVSISSITNLLIFVTFLVVIEMFILPPVNLILYPFNFLVFGQLKNILLILSFILLLNIIPFASFNSFFFNQTNFMGIIIPQVSFDRFIFIIIFALLYKFVKNMVFVESKKKR